MKTFSHRLASLRNERGLTQEELAKALNIGRSTLAAYELGNREPGFDTLCTLAKFFGVTTDYMLGYALPQSDADEVFAHDNDNFRRHFNALPQNLKTAVAQLYDDVYVLLSRDIQTANKARLTAYAELLRTLREGRSKVKSTVDNPFGKGQDPVYLAELMTLQNNLKSEIASRLDGLLQADFETAYKIKNGRKRELSRESGT